MFGFLVKKFVKESEDINNPVVRERYGKFTGITGIMLNAVLCTLKIAIGIITGAISIVSDGINNLSDAASSVITLLGFKLSAKKPDKKHPYGHGRIEYFAGLAVSIVILMVAVKLFTDSLGKIINKETTEYAGTGVFIITVIILLVSIAVKTWMAFFMKYCGRKINSVAMQATGLDAFTDCISTAVVLICAVLTFFVGDFPIDGIAGIIVSLFVAFTGIRSIVEIVNLLLGEAPDEELVKEIADFVLNFNTNVVGIHDFMFHDYGPGRKIVVLHVEVPAEGNIMELHDMIDNIERGIEKKYNCLATIHMDPVETESKRVNELKEVCRNIVKGIDENFDIHDFRMNEGETHANLIFDILLTHETTLIPETVESLVAEKVREYDEKLSAVVKAEYPLI